MKIIKLTAENIKKLVAVEITPKGNVIKITGKNGAGKTSVLDAIRFALGGNSEIQSQPIRKGEKKAKAELDLGDYIVRRTFTENGSSLIIENKEGARYGSPQAMLDAILGKLSFDPLGFMRLDPAKQFETLKSLTGVDTSDIEAKRKTAYEERTAVNRELKSVESRYNAISVPLDVPEKETLSTEIADKITKANEVINNHEKAVEKNKRLTEDITRGQAKIDQLKEEIKKCEEAVKKLEIERELNLLLTKVDLPDVKVLQVELANVDSRNKAFRLKQDKDKLKTELDEQKKKSEKLTTDIETLDQEKLNRVSSAKFPIEGLAFGEGFITYGGLPLDQASDAEKLRVSMAMAMAMNPKLRVLRITDGSLLDSTSMKIIEDMAKNNDYQVWVEVVDESGKIGIVIDDGAVIKNNELFEEKNDGK
jgi:DNA repair exonuclease SbcCD ATPase subunit